MRFENGASAPNQIAPAASREGGTMGRSLWTALTAVTLMAVVSHAQAQETYRIGGDEVAIYNLAGHVEVVRGSGSEVVVRVTRGGADAARLDMEVGAVGGREALRVIYPDDRIVYPEMGRGSSTNIRVRSDGTFFGEGSRGSRVEIRGSGSGLEAWADLRVELPPGRDFVLYLAAGNSEVSGVSGDIGVDTGSGSVVVDDVTGSLMVDTGSGSVDVANVAGPVVIDTGSGRAGVSGIRGDVRVDTGSGSVSLERVEAEVVDVDTGSGRVSGRGIRSGFVRVDTGSGSVELDEVSAPEVEVDTGSGSVDLTLLVDVDRLEVDTGSGSVTIRAPADLGGQVEIDTGSGGIDTDFPVQVRSMRRDLLRGTIGDGRGEIRIDTGSGGVRLIRN
jgi:hypothetical protein